MEFRFIMLIILTIFITCLIIGGAIYSVYLTQYWDVQIIKTSIKKGENIDNYDVEGRKHERTIRKLLTEAGYEYKKVILPDEKIIIYGVGKTDFADGNSQYHIYVGKNELWDNVAKEDYLEAKNNIGKELTCRRSEMKWTRVK